MTVRSIPDFDIAYRTPWASISVLFPHSSPPFCGGPRLSARKDSYQLYFFCRCGPILPQLSQPARFLALIFMLYHNSMTCFLNVLSRS